MKGWKEVQMSVAQPLPIGFSFVCFGNFRPWLCQDYLYFSSEVLLEILVTIVDLIKSQMEGLSGNFRCCRYQSNGIWICLVWKCCTNCLGNCMLNDKVRCLSSRARLVFFCLFEATKVEEQQDPPEHFADVFPGLARIQDRHSTVDDGYDNQHAGVSMATIQIQIFASPTLCKDDGFDLKFISSCCLRKPAFVEGASWVVFANEVSS